MRGFFYVLLFCPLLGHAQGKYLSSGFQNFPFQKDVYVPQTGAYVSYGRINVFSFDLLVRSGWPQKLEWPDKGKFYIVNNHANLLLSKHFRLVERHKWDMAIKLGGGVSFFNVRRVFANRAMREAVAPFTYSKFGFTCYFGLEGNYYVNEKYGVNMGVGVGAYFFKVGLIKRL